MRGRTWEDDGEGEYPVFITCFSVTKFTARLGHIGNSKAFIVNFVRQKQLVRSSVLCGDEVAGGRIWEHDGEGDCPAVANYS